MFNDKGRPARAALFFLMVHHVAAALTTLPQRSPGFALGKQGGQALFNV